MAKKKTSSYKKNIKSLKKKTYKVKKKKVEVKNITTKNKYTSNDIKKMEMAAEKLQAEIKKAKEGQAKKEKKEVKYRFDSGTVFNVNSDILKAKKRKYPKEYADRLQAEIKKQEHYNKKINLERRKLKKEQITRGTSGYRVKKIDQILKGNLPIKMKFTAKEIKKNKLPKEINKKEFLLLPENLAFKKNEVNLYKGKDFYYYFDDRFSKYKIKQSSLLKRIKNGENISEVILNNMEKKVKYWNDKNNKYIEDNKGKFSKEKNKKLKNKKKALEKLLNVINANKKFLENMDEKEFKATELYPITISLIGTQIII